MLYENTWESIDSRPVPEWFEDAKLGIFVHFGIYSVPAFAASSDETAYAEWYGFTCDRDEDENQFGRRGYQNEAERNARLHHLKYYGKNFKYNDFVNDFKAEFFDGDEWAELFKKSGAKYFNLVSKHHDGFCLYKSRFHENWNSVDVGPHRDFCRELKNACDKTGIKFGVYHSVYEWFNTLCNENPEEYAVKQLIPMLKELVEAYHPATLFTDGEWEQPSSVWHSTEFLQWLYNESSVKDFIVPNDRWGSDTRGRHGGNLTTEYNIIGNGVDCQSLNHPSEECRGIGRSFGYNRFETVDDYLSEDELIKLFVDTISNGSNLLLNIGPRADGRIDPIQEERLLQLGKWIETNGEAVYSSRKYVDSTTDDVVYTREGDTIYAFVKKYPFGEIILNDVKFDKDLSVEPLGAERRIDTFNSDGKLGINVPFISPDHWNSKCVYVFKIK